LKTGSLFVFKLTGDGGSVQGDTQQLPIGASAASRR
jgi:hypothetical protein